LQRTGTLTQNGYASIVERQPPANSLTASAFIAALSNLLHQPFDAKHQVSMKIPLNLLTRTANWIRLSAIFPEQYPSSLGQYALEGSF
jgi:hypothetical protein